jgi:pyrroline-5-carboxylate reductase
MNQHIVFVGGGNMASAIIGGLLKTGLSRAQLQVVEPWPEARARLQNQFGIATQESADARLASADLVVWAVKPQNFKEAAAPVRPHTLNALHLSVAAGIRSDSIAQWVGTDRVVRSMPNTPALIGMGVTALFARSAVTTTDRHWVEQVVATTGDHLWVDDESALDAVTALSGSGPAYIFFFIEAMVRAGVEMGLPPAQARQLAIGTFSGAAELARTSEEAPEVLRQRVTSKGGTTYAAISSMESSGVQSLFIEAMHAARERARQLGDEFGR